MILEDSISLLLEIRCQKLGRDRDENILKLVKAFSSYDVTLSLYLFGRSLIELYIGFLSDVLKQVMGYPHGICVPKTNRVSYPKI